VSQQLDLGGDGDANSKKYGNEEKIWKKERTCFKTEEEWTVADCSYSFIHFQNSDLKNGGSTDHTDPRQRDDHHSRAQLCLNGHHDQLIIQYADKMISQEGHGGRGRFREKGFL